MDYVSLSRHGIQALQGLDSKPPPSEVHSDIQSRTRSKQAFPASDKFNEWKAFFLSKRNGRNRRQMNKGKPSVTCLKIKGYGIKVEISKLPEACGIGSPAAERPCCCTPMTLVHNRTELPYPPQLATGALHESRRLVGFPRRSSFFNYEC